YYRFSYLCTCDHTDLHSFPTRRSSDLGESIRDAILAVSGRLDRTMYGPSIQPYREEPKDYRKLYQGPLDGNGRRSIYIKVTRHEDRKSTRLNSSHGSISYAVFCLKKKT